jgi:primosomal protein N' (replication factor Y) (superfamily II helicase)
MSYMYYYDVLVSSQRYHGSSSLTYEHKESLRIGSVVSVPLQNQTVLGIIVNKNSSAPSHKTKQILKVIVDSAVPAELLELILWFQIYYPAPLGQVLSLFLPAGLSQASRKQRIIKDSAGKLPDLPPLTKEQKKALEVINNTEGAALLHGDTGSGKTRVYIELAKDALAKAKSAIILTPEIGLTPQLINSFTAVFPDSIYLLHSTLTPAERRDTWLEIANSEKPLIVIGPRSALFSPVKNLGLIVLDEAHDPAYKQEQAPYYQTTRVASKLARLHKARMLLGSATPLVSDYYTFKSKGLAIARMQKPAINSSDSVEFKIINLRDHEQFNRSTWLSKALLEAISTTLDNGQQSLLFLNRRGTARLVLCQICGWQALCPRCDLPLTYHGDSHQMLCHTCGYTEPAPTMCPVCQATDITFRSIGTKSLVEELNRLFPKAKIGRFDSDTKKSDRLESQYESIRDGKVDILVGTQMLGKGLDLPKLAVLGIVVADTGLYFPDYTAEERTFQMLTQVMGRVNRGHTKGKIIVQTYHPENPVIQSAISKDYDSFYEQQIKERSQFGFPPFTFILKLQCSRSSRSAAQQAAERLLGQLKENGLPVGLRGPSPAFIEKRNDRFYWQLVITAKQRSYLLDIIKALPANWRHDIDPSHLL